MTSQSLDERTPLQLLGVGIGPANLSLAALIDGSSQCAPLRRRSLFLEQHSRFEWHPGQLFPDTRMQNSFARDLVSLADPTNPHTFINYLKTNGRLLQFLNAGFFFPYRREFIDYMRRVAEHLPHLLRFGSRVTRVEYSSALNAFTVTAISGADERHYLAQNVVIGTGFRPRVPAEADPAHSIHVSRFLDSRLSTAGKAILVVGGAQSGAELVEHLLSTNAPPRRLVWLTRGSAFGALDTSNFAREIYTPGYASYFSTLSPSARQRVLQRDTLAESGVSPTLMERIAQLMYRERYVERRGLEIELRTQHTVVGAITRNGRPVAVVNSPRMNGIEFPADVIVWCTGYEPVPLIELGPLFASAQVDPLYAIADDHSVPIEGAPDGRAVFLQSLGRHVHGASDANFTMVCHRNARILNTIMQSDAFSVPLLDNALTLASGI